LNYIWTNYYKYLIGITFSNFKIIRFC